MRHIFLIAHVIITVEPLYSSVQQANSRHMHSMVNTYGCDDIAVWPTNVILQYGADEVTLAWWQSEVRKSSTPSIIQLLLLSPG